MTDSQTIPDAHGIARDQLRAFIERVERVEEEIATLNTDKSDIYKEARAVGFDVKVLRKVVAKRKLETHVREEQDAIFDMYWEALHGAPVHVHTHARENIEEFPVSDPATNGRGPSLTTREAEESVVSNHEMDRATEGSFETGSEAAEKGREAIPAGPEGADLNHAGAGESPATASKPKVSFRPNCQHPENCASGTRDHCWSCRRAMQKSEEMA